MGCSPQEWGPNSFLVKPLDFQDLTAMMRTLRALWIYQSKNPTIERRPKKNGAEEGREVSGKG